MQRQYLILRAVMWQRIFLFTAIFFSFTSNVEPRGQRQPPPDEIPPYLYVNSKWVDSLLHSMTPDQRIGQLFMVATFSRPDSDQAKIVNLIRQYNIGGLIFMQGGPVRQAQLTNFFQSIATVPLFIAQDAEWGLAMRLDSTIRFPKELMLGAIQNNQLIYDFGLEMARQCKRIGVNVSFSPVVDVNSNPLNPVIGERSFGEDKYNVAEKGIMYMRGLQDGGVLACAKHFPGHGDTEEDSHATLPLVTASRQQLDSLELFPFKKLIHEGVGSVMVAHLSIPSLDTSKNLPSSLSKRIVTGLLKVDMSFKGLSFTDALNMKGVTGFSESGAIDVQALLAGNDVLLYSGDVPSAVSLIKEAMIRGEISQDDIDARVRKILKAKYWMGLSVRQPVRLTGIYEDLNDPSALYLKQRLTENALTVIRDNDKLIPFERIDTFRFASVAIGATSVTPFQEMLSNYAVIEHFQIRKDASNKDFNALLDQLKNCNAVFVGLGNMSRLPANGFGITQNTKDFIKELQQQCKVILTVFGNPYALKYFDSSDCLLMAFNDDSVTQVMSAQLLFGGITGQGKLPVTASPKTVNGLGIATYKQIRVKYSMAEDAGINTSRLKVIDSIVYEAIEQHATPGCQVWIAKGGEVIWNKSYGRFTYDIDVPVQNNDLYDIASITKIAATAMVIMKLYEEKKLDLDKTVSYYLKEFENTNKKNITVRQLLTHEGGLKAYIPFYRETVDTAGKLLASVYSLLKQGEFNVEVTPDIFMNKQYQDTIWNKILISSLGDSGKYLYSDLDFYFLQKIAEKVSGKPIDQYVKDQFYKPMGLSEITFNPLVEVPKEEIVPSNYDFFWRKEVVQGTVHDQGAAMMGGVAGHAGLFSNAASLGTLMQMLLNNGMYGGRQYLDSSTIKTFTSRNSTRSRRGLGFDKPETDAMKPSPTCPSASPSTFGHQGFTGTCVWVDPQYDLVYVFLSNRTFPDDENGKLGELQTRTRIHEAIYQAMKGSE